MYIDKTRHTLDHVISPLVLESYNRAYKELVMLQQLSEMEEIIKYKKLLRSPGKQNVLSVLP